MNAHVPEHAAVWFEIPVADMERAQKFYGAVLQNELAPQDGGPNPLSMFKARDQESIAGHIYPGRPATAGTGPTIHLTAAAPIEAALQRVTENGGQVVSSVIEIPAGRFAYCLDPDGNSFGLFVR